MTEPSLRLRLTGLPPRLPDRARVGLRRVLSLAPDEVERLGSVLPLELLVGPPHAADAARTVEACAADGVVSTVQPATTPLVACASHPRLLESDVCPECTERGCPACVRLTTSRRCHRCRRTQRRWTLLRRVRIAMLLVMLAIVGGITVLDQRKIASWAAPVRVVVHPIVGEPSDGVEAYVGSFGAAQLAPAAELIDTEARRYGRSLEPRAVELVLGRRLPEQPPRVPEDAGPLSAIVWSLSFRAWALRAAWRHDLEPGDVRLFLVFHEAVAGRTLEHSTGLEKGRIGVVKLFAAPGAEPLNSVVLAHELLHTLGATDKYGPGGQPVEPHGLGEPTRGYPQVLAELMAGAVALSPTEARLPASLDECVIGRQTALELGWLSE